MGDVPRTARHAAAPRSHAQARAARPMFLAADDQADPFATSSETPQSSPDGVPNLTMPTIPALKTLAKPHPVAQDSTETSKRRTLLDGATGRHSSLRLPKSDPDDSETFFDWRDETNQYGSDYRLRDQSEARPLSQPIGAMLKLPSREPSQFSAKSKAQKESPRVFMTARTRGITTRLHTETRMLVGAARRPWSIARGLLAVIAVVTAFWFSLSVAGEASQPLMATAYTYQSSAGSHAAASVTDLVRPETQGKRPDLYDNDAQFQLWWDAACSAAVSSEVLTGWGVPHVTIGRMIDVMQPDISAYGGLLNYHGFERGAATFGYRADVGSATYNQLLYMTNQLGLPVIVNVRIAYGYYHFFDSGHFLVVTGGDAQGLRIVDSSEYYIHYLPRDTFLQMYTSHSVVIVPKDYQYSVAA